MSGALVPVPRRRPSRLSRLRRLAHQALPRLAFVLETLAIAAGLLEFLVLALLQGDRLLAAHEWGLFLTHYAAAPGPARTPVDLMLVGALTSLWLFAGACRLPAARLIWRAADLEARR